MGFSGRSPGLGCLCRTGWGEADSALALWCCSPWTGHWFLVIDPCYNSFSSLLLLFRAFSLSSRVILVSIILVPIITFITLVVLSDIAVCLPVVFG